MQNDPMTPAKLKVVTHDTTLEALLTGKAKLARFDTWPEILPLELADPFRQSMPCWIENPFRAVGFSQVDAGRKRG